MNEKYVPKSYWENRLSNRFSLRGVGHIGFSESYNVWLYRRKEQCIESCLANTTIKEKNVLDIGCGTGFFVNWYLKKEANVCGIDLTSVSIERLKQKYRGEFYIQDITDTEYILNGRSFDIINMWDVVYHIVDNDRFYQAFDNISKSISKNGLLLFTDWFGASSDIHSADHVKIRCLDTYNEFLPKHGFELVGIYPLYNYLNKVHLKKIDNFLGRFYSYLDQRSNKIPSDNLSLSLWRFNPISG